MSKSTIVRTYTDWIAGYNAGYTAYNKKGNLDSRDIEIFKKLNLNKTLNYSFRDNSNTAAYQSGSLIGLGGGINNGQFAFIFNAGWRIIVVFIDQNRTKYWVKMPVNYY